MTDCPGFVPDPPPLHITGDVHAWHSATASPLPTYRGLAEALSAVERFLRRFVALSDAQAVAIVLWVAMTYVAEAFEAVAYLYVHSPEKRSGKTRLLDTLAVLTLRPMLAADMTPAVLFRVLDQTKPTLLFDEVDVVFGGKSERADELRGLLNAGYKRGGAAWRMEMNGKSGTARSFDVFGPKALCGIAGNLPDTLADRSIGIEMARKHRSVPIERFRLRGKLEETAAIREELTSWAEAAIERLSLARPELPDELNDRQQDVWESLLAIADEGGGDWPSRARAAARGLHAEGDEADTSLRVLLLRHVREVFSEGPAEVALATEKILDGLIGRDDGPWARWWSTESDHAKRSSASGLARHLKPFGISSTKVRIGASSVRGYRREDFADAWERYLSEVDGTDAPDGTPQVGPASTVPSVPYVPSTSQAEPAWRRLQREADEDSETDNAAAVATVADILEAVVEGAP